jgi:hypothetical protein
MNPHAKSNLRLFFSLLAVVIGFGSQWNCTIQIGDGGAKGGGGQAQDAGSSTGPSSGSGCFNQMPAYTLGEPPSKEEYTIFVKVYAPKKPGDSERFWAEAHGLSAELRAKRIHNSIWPQDDGSIAVSVGRYFTEKQALDKLPALHARGYDEAYVGKPRVATPPPPPPPPPPDYAGIVAVLIIVVLVILGVAAQTKK